jgi:hypothetical protein
MHTVYFEQVHFLCYILLILQSSLLLPLFNRWENWSSTCRRLRLDPSLLSFTKINSKWIKDLNIWKCYRKTWEEIVVGNYFLNRNLQHLFWHFCQRSDSCKSVLLFLGLCSVPLIFMSVFFFSTMLFLLLWLCRIIWSLLLC